MSQERFSNPRSRIPLMQTPAPAPGVTASSRPGEVSPSAPACRIWADDEKTFSMDRVCRIHHNFHQHPLMEISRLETLAQKLMTTKQCRFIKPGATQSSDFTTAAKAPDGRDLTEVFRRIEEPGSWIALYNVETDPDYGRFVNDALQTVRHLIDREQPGMFNAQGFMFISAPPSVTPFHIDRENNFWLQIRGRKIMNVWEASDRETVAAPDVETFITQKSLEGVKFREDIRARSHELDCGPGDGLYFPSTAPHMTRCTTDWVRPGDGVSISIGIVFYTDVTRKHANVHAFNKFLRRFGMNPRFPGESSAADALKYPLGRALVATRRLRGYQPPTGF
jgi:hypothetical protein